MAEGERIADHEDVPEESTLLVTVRDDDTDEEREAILTRRNGAVTGWFNYCQHWRDVRLDTGDGALVRNGEIVCQKHAATFEADSGYCNFGPCEGAVLDELDVEHVDGGVYLTDDDYSFVRVGPTERDVDRASGGRIDF